MENGQDNTTLILVVGVCFSCMLSLGALVFAYYQGWLDNIIEWFKGEDEEEPTPPSSDPVDGSEPTNTTDEGNTPSDSEEPTTPGGDGTSSSSGCNPDDPNKQCTNQSGYHHVCPEPWSRGFLKYSTNGKGKRCCKNKDQKYAECADEAIRVPDGFPTDAVHKTVTSTFSGKIKGPLKKQDCPDGSGGESIVYQERNSKGHVQQTWCHPVNAQKAYAVYPMCYTSNSGGAYAKSSDPGRVWANKSAITCTNDKKVRWEKYDKAQGKGDRHRYVKYGTN